MPWFIDAGLLFYRKVAGQYDAQPSNLAGTDGDREKIQDAERTAGNDKIWGFVWGRAYEG